MSQYKEALRYISNYGWNSIFFKYWKKIVLFLSIPFIIINATVFFAIQKKSETELKTAISQAFNKATDSADNIFSEINNNFLFLSTSNNIIAYLGIQNQTPKSITELNTLSIISNLITAFTTTSSYLDALHIYYIDKGYVLSTRGGNTIENFYNRQWYEEYIKTGRTNFICYSKSNNIMIPDTFSVCYGLNFSGKLQGLIVYEIKITAFMQNILSEDFPKNGIILSDNNGFLFAARGANQPFDTERYDLNSIPVSTSVNTLIHTSDSEIIIKTMLSSNGLNFITISPAFNDTERIAGLLFVVLICLIATLLLAMFISYYLSLQFYQYIVEITAHFEDKSGIGDNNTNKINELLFITKNILSLIANKNNLEATLAEKVLALKNAQTIALQSQFNPHFLFNTLNLVNVLIMNITKKECDAGNVIVLLSDLLREALNTKKYIVPFSEEISYVKKYLEIECIKYKNAFDINWRIEDSVLKCKVIKFMLQPIIENAINHGLTLKKQNESKKLDIYAAVLSDCVKVTVTDNGRGIDPNKLIEIENQLLNSDVFSNSNHIGLSNVNNRIKIIFGNEYGLSIASNNNGTKIDIILPRIEEDSQ